MSSIIYTAACAAAFVAGAVPVVSANSGRALLSEDGSSGVHQQIQMLREQIRELKLPFALKKVEAVEEAAEEEEAEDEVDTLQSRTLKQGDVDELTPAELEIEEKKIEAEIEDRREDRRQAKIEARAAEALRRYEFSVALAERKAKVAEQRLQNCEKRIENVERRNEHRASLGRDLLPVPVCKETPPARTIRPPRNVRDFRAPTCARRYRDCSDLPCCRESDECSKEEVGGFAKLICVRKQVERGAYGK